MLVSILKVIFWSCVVFTVLGKLNDFRGILSSAFNSASVTSVVLGELVLIRQISMGVWQPACANDNTWLNFSARRQFFRQICFWTADFHKDCRQFLALRAVLRDLPSRKGSTFLRNVVWVFSNPCLLGLFSGFHFNRSCFVERFWHLLLEKPFFFVAAQESWIFSGYTTSSFLFITSCCKFVRSFPDKSKRDAFSLKTSWVMKWSRLMMFQIGSVSESYLGWYHPLLSAASSTSSWRVFSWFLREIRLILSLCPLWGLNRIQSVFLGEYSGSVGHSFLQWCKN